MGIWYDKEAYQLLKKCSDLKDLTEWNEYRKATSYTPVNLRFVNLSSFYLRNAELQSVDLRGASFIDSDFNYADVKNANISSAIFLKLCFLSFIVGFGMAWVYISLDKFWINFIVDVSVIGAVAGAIFLVSIIANIRADIFGNMINIMISLAIIVSSLVIGVIAKIINNAGILAIDNYMTNVFNNLSLISASTIILNIVAITLTLLTVLVMILGSKEHEKPISLAKNPDKVIGFRKKHFQNKPTNIAEELQKEASELGKEIAMSQDDKEKQKLLFRQQELDEKIDFFTKQEIDARIQQTRIENVINELQSPYIYIHQTINSIQWHNRIFYSAIFALLILFIYAITHGYIDQRVVSFTSLFLKETQPGFGTIFGVILFYGTPILLGISLIIYFITQINKNIEKITELQEQERNIKQIASTIKAKAQIGMSDEEFVKETKNLIQKYQEGMMAGMFTKEKIMDKEDKSSLSTYREKLIANGISKLLMQALKK